jgi:hypothetical protein
LAYFLFIIYFLIICFVLTKIKFVTQTSLGDKTILGLFAIKIMAGLVLGMVCYYYYNGLSDYTGINENGIFEYNNLLHHPKIFFTDIFISNYGENYGEFFGTKGSYFNDLRGNILYKVLGFCNILSGGNYYINSLFFNFCCFLGHIALYKIFIAEYSTKKWQAVIGSFLLPSTLYYSSGIHKDLVVFVGLAFFCYAMYFGLKNSFTTKKIVVLLFSFLLLLAIRNFVAILLLPIAATWFYCKSSKLHPAKTYAVALSILVVVSSILHFTSEKFDPLKVVINKQKAFLDLGKANTQYVNDTLQNSIVSFTTAAPIALRHSFLSPYPFEFNNIFLQIQSLELIAYFLLLILFFIFKEKKDKPFINSFTLFCFVFVFLIFLFIGYITPNAGTLVRYRSIYLPFVITPLLCSINWTVVKVRLAGQKKSH